MDDLTSVDDLTISSLQVLIVTAELPFEPLHTAEQAGGSPLGISAITIDGYIKFSFAVPGPNSC